MFGVKIVQIYFLACDVFHLSQGYGFIMMLCSTEVIDGLTLSIPSVTPSQFQQFVMITFFSCTFSQIPYSQHHHLKWAYASSLYGCYSYLYHLGKSQLLSMFAMVSTYFITFSTSNINVIFITLWTLTTGISFITF